ncbi:hypothetical protein FQU76_03765 [Streptomyces qinzhouensis]|uniref:Uncharacterized protein n=1 Tax=Streptomyces qinzhouensis TaxID=2599401 RepID=A0A5B8IF27_9ACTN|nr:hypothetical protein FQU76_03765 [Streptomyces qinzhouensis]
MCFFKGTSSPTTRAENGVSTYLALIFGTLLSSQGTDASFRPFSPGPPGFPFDVSNLIRLFPARSPPSSVPLQTGRGVDQLGSRFERSLPTPDSQSRWGQAGVRHYRSPEYEANRLRCVPTPSTGRFRAEPGLHLTYALTQF